MILQGNSFDRFFDFYDFDDPDSIPLYVIYSGIVLLISLFICDVLTVKDSSRFIVRKQADGEWDWESRPSYLAYQRSGWVVYNNVLFLVPLMFFVPPIQKFSPNPSLCSWTQLYKGPQAFVVTLGQVGLGWTSIVYANKEGMELRAEAMQTKQRRARQIKFVHGVLVEWCGYLAGICQAGIYLVPRCIFEPHQCFVDGMIVFTWTYACLIELKRPSQARYALPLIAIGLFALAYLNACACYLYPIMEMYTQWAGAQLVSVGAAASIPFSLSEYMLKSIPITYFVWMVQQMAVNFCINRELPLELGGSATNGMPKRDFKEIDQLSWFGKYEDAFSAGEVFWDKGVEFRSSETGEILKPFYQRTMFQYGIALILLTFLWVLFHMTISLRRRGRARRRRIVIPN